MRKFDFILSEEFCVADLYDQTNMLERLSGSLVYFPLANRKSNLPLDLKLKILANVIWDKDNQETRKKWRLEEHQEKGKGRKKGRKEGRKRKRPKKETFVKTTA